MPLLQQLHSMPPMSLTSLSFVYVFLPLSLFVYYILPCKTRPAALLAVTLLFYVQAQPRGLVLLATSVLMDYGAMRVLGHWEADSVRRSCVWFSVVKNLIMIVYAGAIVQMRGVGLSLGLLVYTLSAMSCVLAAYRGEIACERSLVRFALGCSFFPMLYAGPLVPYGSFAPQLERLELNPRRVLVGLGRFVQGALKQAVFGGSLYALYLSIGKLGDVTVLSAWCLVLVLALAVYFTLSGFADMAQGLGGMFGLELPKNFYYPYQSRSVQDFFQRFNITVGRLIQSALSLSLDGKSGVAADVSATLCMGALMGLWFGLRVNYLAWGVSLAAVVLLEKYVYRGLMEKVPTLFCRGFTFCVMLCSFTIFAGNSLGQGVRLLGAMFGHGVARLTDDSILYLLSSNWLLLVIACFLATSGVNIVVTQLRKSVPVVSYVVLAAVDTAVLLVFTALTV